MQAWLTFLATSALLDRRIDQQLKQAVGLSHTQYQTLVRLSDAARGEMHMTALADAMSASKSTLTYQITQLDRAGLVQRRPCPHDERGIHASITAAGRRTLRQAAPGHAALIRELFTCVLTAHERRTLTQAFGKILQHAAPPG